MGRFRRIRRNSHSPARIAGMRDHPQSTKQLLLGTSRLSGNALIAMGHYWVRASTVASAEPDTTSGSLEQSRGDNREQSHLGDVCSEFHPPSTTPEHSHTRFQVGLLGPSLSEPSQVLAVGKRERNRPLQETDGV